MDIIQIVTVLRTTNQRWKNLTNGRPPMRRNTRSWQITVRLSDLPVGVAWWPIGQPTLLGRSVRTAIIRYARQDLPSVYIPMVRSVLIVWSRTSFHVPKKLLAILDCVTSVFRPTWLRTIRYINHRIPILLWHTPPKKNKIVCLLSGTILIMEEDNVEIVNGVKIRIISGDAFYCDFCQMICVTIEYEDHHGCWDCGARKCTDCHNAPVTDPYTCQKCGATEE